MTVADRRRSFSVARLESSPPGARKFPVGFGVDLRARAFTLVLWPRSLSARLVGQYPGRHADTRRVIMGESTPASNRLNELQRAHSELKNEVRILERRAYLTPTEQHQMTELKKQKLS